MVTGRGTTWKHLVGPPCNPCLEGVAEKLKRAVPTGQALSSWPTAAGPGDVVSLSEAERGLPRRYTETARPPSKVTEAIYTVQPLSPIAPTQACVQSLHRLLRNPIFLVGSAVQPIHGDTSDAYFRVGYPLGFTDASASHPRIPCDRNLDSHRHLRLEWRPHAAERSERERGI